jgi:hypothetical protein
MSMGLPRHAEFERRLQADFGVTDIRVYYAFSIAGDAFIAIRGEQVEFVQSGALYSDSIEPALYRVVARKFGLLPSLEEEWTNRGKE